ncbi:MAG: MFS transporter [Deltaproteobacteria bacterium]|nr:MFS transporter [Deltaproteobacteria bacterium]
MRVSFFYGWVIVAISMLAGFLGSGVSNVTMAVVLKPISEDLGWSRTLTSSAITLGSITGGLLSPLFGPIADRLGPRYLLPLGAAMVGTAVLALSLSYEPWQFYATFVPGRALAETLMTGVVPMTAVANWFYVMRPRAIGLVAMSVPLGSFALSLLYQTMIAAYGWRSAFMMLGAAMWILVVVPGLLFLRRQPEDLGLLPDGAVSSPPHSKATKLATDQGGIKPVERSWSLREATRTGTLWLLVGAGTLASISTGGVAFHLVAYFTDLKIPPAMAVGALSLMALTGAFGNGVWGTLAEKIHPRRLGIISLVLSASAVGLLTQVKLAPMAFFVAILFGLSARGGFVLMHVLVARYYGRRSFGAISSVLEPFHKGGLGVGALLAGMAFDFTGSYQLVFLSFVGNYLLSALLTFLARQPSITRNDLVPGA